MRVLFVFLDGVGIGPPDPSLNPFLTARIPTLLALLNDQVPVLEGSIPSCTGPPTNDETGEILGWETVVRPLDPLMGMEGLPQSGTGQVALLTGENAAHKYGRHFGPWVPVPLRPLMMESNLLTLAVEAGFSCTFANAYPSMFIERIRVKRPAGPPLAAHGAGLLTRTELELARGDAISSEIHNTAWRERLGLTHLPEISPEEAGRNLAGISQRFSLTFFAHYSTDTAGHSRSMKAARVALERFDAFLSGLVTALDPSTLLVLASDHGNIEDISRGHTRNPTFNLLAGPGARETGADLETITDLSPAILNLLKQGG